MRGISSEDNPMSKCVIAVATVLSALVGGTQPSVATPPGSAVYLAVDDNWVNDDTQGSRTPVFSIAPIDPAIALPQVARLPLERGR